MRHTIKTSLGRDSTVGASGFQSWSRNARMAAYVQVSRTPGTMQEVGHGVAGVREAPRHEIAGGFQVYGDLSGAAMMAALA